MRPQGREQKQFRKRPETGLGSSDAKERRSLHPARLLAYGLTLPPPSLPAGNGIRGLVADYSGATAPDSHGLPIAGAKYGGSIAQWARPVNSALCAELMWS